MPYDPKKHHRRSIRLKGYDYTQPGAYFITLCTQHRACLFGEVVDGRMVLNDAGRIVREEWFRTANLRPYVVLHDDEFVVMPNHVHGIIWIVDEGDEAGPHVVGSRRRVVGSRRRRDPTTTTTEQFGKPVPGSIPTIVRAFKSAVTRRINEYRGTPGMPVWQRNYYEHIIRDERSLHRIRRYIADNPARWARDRNNPPATK